MDGRYRVLELIGRGGMGEVYRVEHVRIPKIAAMKILHPELAREQEVVARFRREAKAVSKLSHPHTAQVFDFGEHDHALYLVMEFAKGRDLGSLCRELGPLPYVRAVPMAVQICLAMEEAHGLGIVHRDVKPENVLVSRGTDDADYVKVLDFGLALLREGADQADITAQGNVIGTPYYMAPEQIRGEEVDHRVDIYAIGATLYRMVTGVVPFPAKTPVGVLTKCLTEPLDPPCKRRPDLNIPGELESVIMRAMAKDRDERYASVRDLRKALQTTLASLTTAPVRVLGAGTGDPWAQSSMPGLAVASSPFLSENNLRREDLDRFERRFRWRRRLVVLLPVLLLILAGAAVGAWIWLRRPSKSIALSQEREPNNTTVEANPIARGRPVRGQIGKRISETQSDVDAYRFQVRAKGPVVLSARVTGIPYINTSLQIYAEDGRELAAVDNGPARSDEVLPNLVIPPGRYFAVVQEVAGNIPGTNVNDWYRLTVSWRPLRKDEEVEPNDSLETANRVRSGEVVVGYLSRVDDVDVFWPEGSGGGTVDVVLMGAKGLDLRLRAVGLERGAVASAGSGVPLAGRSRRLKWTRLADNAGAGGAEQLQGLPWPKGAPAPMILVEPGGNAAPPPGLLDNPYRLQVTFHPGPAGPPPSRVRSPRAASARARVPGAQMATGGSARPPPRLRWAPRGAMAGPRPGPTVPRAGRRPVPAAAGSRPRPGPAAARAGGRPGPEAGRRPVPAAAGSRPRPGPAAARAGGRPGPRAGRRPPPNRSGRPPRPPGSR